MRVEKIEALKAEFTISFTRLEIQQVKEDFDRANRLLLKEIHPETESFITKVYDALNILWENH